MSYLTQSRRPSAASMAGVVAIHALVGVAIVTGLTVSGVIEEKDGPISTFPIPTETPPPPPPPPPPPKAQPRTPVDPLPLPPIPAPTPPLDLVPTPPVVPTGPSTTLPPFPLPSGGTGEAIDRVIPIPTPTPQPGFPAVAAKPRNNPGAWLSDADYRSNWVRQELTGVARFRLEIGANGRVTGCTVLRGTGHSELDTATCDLVTKRARFEPARGRDGAATAGSYTGSVEWRLPE